MKIKRPLLLPFSPLYAFITWTRNKLFDTGVLKSQSFKLPVITIGNLNVGGTGKTPHTLWVLKLISLKVKTAVVSRGYGRKSKGYILANNHSTVEDIGDEPKEITQRYSNVLMAVAEKRAEGISNLLTETAKPEAIILDDAFQHRYVKAGLNILLSTYNDLFTKDYLLPGGNLRELRSGYSRADIIIITKCREDLSHEDREKIKAQIKLKPHQKIGFSYFRYGKPFNPKGEEKKLPRRFVLLTGIAQTDYLVNYLSKHHCTHEHLNFKDHHAYTDKDYEKIKSHCSAFQTKIIITTSKDFARLDTRHAALNGIEILQLPIEVKFLAGGNEIESQILSFVLNN